MALNQRKAGVMLSYIQLGLSTLVGILYTPIMLRILGQSEYGLFGTANSLTSCLSLLSFGVTGAYMKFVMEYRATGDKEGEKRLNGTFVLLFSLFSLLVVIVGAALLFFSDSIYDKSLTAYELVQIKWIMLLTIINTVFTFLFIPVMMFIQSYEKYLFLRIIALITTILNPIMNLIVISFIPKAVSISVIGLVIALLTYLAYLIYAYKKLEMRFSFRHLKLSVFKSIFIFSSFLMLNQITDLITNNTDRLVLGITSGTVAVAIYTVGANLSTYLYSSSTYISSVFAPSINKIVANAKVNNVSPDYELNQLFIKVGRVQFLILTLIIVGFSTLGQQFIALWAGENYEYAFWIALLLMLAPYVPLMQNIGLEIQKAKNLHKARSIVYFLISLLNVGLTIPAAIYFSQPCFNPGLGGIAAAAATFLSMVLGQVVFMNIYYQNKVGVNVLVFWKNILKMLPGVLIPFALGVIFNIFVKSYNWYIFLSEVIAVAVVYCISVYFLSMNQYEKNLFTSPFRKVISKLMKNKKGV